MTPPQIGRPTLLDRILGPPLANWQGEQEKIGVAAGVPILGLDGLSSAAYGPEAALTILMPLGAAGLAYILPITGLILALLAILYLSYRQTIAAYPTGGGSYTVAKENLGTRAGLLAAAALIVDYILNVAVGISAGIGALVSAVPSLHPHILGLCLATLAIITVINLRGVRESGVAFGVPTYLFVGTLATVLISGIVKAVTHGGHPPPVSPPSALPASAGAASLWLLMRSFASGCTAMTGVEAVSNGVSAFAEPAVKNARRTLTAIVVILAFLLAGIAILCRAYGIGAMDQDRPDYQSVISQLVAAVVGRGMFYYITIAAVLAVLALSANTSFAGFPRLCRLIAEDDYLPHAFSTVGRRLVYSIGIGVLAALSALLLIVFGGITDRLIPLFAVGAFGAFTLSQAGMVVHWRRTGGRGATVALTVNAVGAVATGLALAVILVAKFIEGAWITLILIPALLALFVRVHSHYTRVKRQIACPRPMDLSHNDPPVVIVPIEGWNLLTEKALRFGLRLSNEVIAVHVILGEDDQDAIRRQWTADVEAPTRAAGLPQPNVVFLESPYRRLFTPLLDYIRNVLQQFPDRLVAVIIPEMVEKHWYDYLLHNHRATVLRFLLMFYGSQRVVVVTVPWYVEPDGTGNPPSAGCITQDASQASGVVCER